MAGHLGDEDLSACAFSPEQASAGAAEHAADCAECSARIEELTALLSALAELPEPQIPESVILRLDATIEQAWQESDEATRALAQSKRPRRTRKAWLRLSVPITALAVIAGAFIGVGYLISHGAGGTASSASASSGEVAPFAGVESAADPALVTMARQALEGAGENGSFPAARRTASAGSTARTNAPSTSAHAMAHCFHAPQKTGYTVAATAPETYSGTSASLVVYRSDEEPANTTTFYAVLFAGSCPSGSSAVLDQGPVSAGR